MITPTVGYGCTACKPDGVLLVCTERCDEGRALRRGEDLCRACRQSIEFYDSPYGSWWSHQEHLGGGHDAVPGRPEGEVGDGAGR